ncbi:MAG: ABC transporter permease [Candidatus Pacebacteria bacterium]|nr:ABC transporter permease [Candidatus Paceibacterota bacterium]
MNSNNLQTIYVMWLREMKRFFRAKSRVIGTLAMPFFFLFTMGFGFNSGFSLPGISSNINYIDYLVPGIIGMTMLFTSMSAGISVLWDKEFGFLKEIMVAPVSRVAIVLGRIAGGVTTALIQGILILILSLFMGFKITNPLSILLGVVFMILIGIGFIGFGVAIASIMEDTQGFSLIMQFIIFPIFLLSGTFFPITNFPNWLRPFSYIDPLTYGIDGLRGSLIGFSQFSLVLDLTVLVIFSLAMVVLGAWFFNKTEV